VNGDLTSANPAKAGQTSSVTADADQVTRLLANWGQGDEAALEKMTPIVYDELRRLAHRYMQGQRPDHTLQTTALVNEAYLRLVDQTTPSFANRSHFFAVSATAMRQTLVNHAKAHQRQKRGGGASTVDLDTAALMSPEQTKTVLDVDED